MLADQVGEVRAPSGLRLLPRNRPPDASDADDATVRQAGSRGGLELCGPVSGELVEDRASACREAPSSRPVVRRPDASLHAGQVGGLHVEPFRADIVGVVDPDGFHLALDVGLEVESRGEPYAHLFPPVGEPEGLEAADPPDLPGQAVIFQLLENIFVLGRRRPLVGDVPVKVRRRAELLV